MWIPPTGYWVQSVQILYKTSCTYVVKRRKRVYSHMMRIAIVDDDTVFAENVEKQIRCFYAAKGEPVSIWRGCSRDLLNLPDTQQDYDLYFFDVVMPEPDGLKLAEKVRAFDPKARIVLLTSYDRFALQGIRLGVYYYILKDNYMEELLPLLERVLRETLAGREEAYFISTEVSGYKISIHQILYLTKDKKYTVFHCLDGKTYRERDSLENISGRLPGDLFVAANRGIIVNMRHILSLEKLDLTMRDGSVLPVSRYEKANVLNRLTRYWREK